MNYESIGFGLSLFISGSDEGALIGLRPRYRRWLSERASIDVAPGIVLSHGGHVPPGFSGQLGVNLSNWFSLTSTFQVVPIRFYELNPAPPHTPLETRRTVAAWFMGARLASVPGLVTGIAFPTSIVVVLLVACGGGRCFD